MRYSRLDELDEGTLALGLVIVGSVVSWAALTFALAASSLDTLLSTLLVLLRLVAAVVVLWGVYFGIRVLRLVSAGRRNVAAAAVGLGIVTLLPWIVYLLSPY